MTATKCIHRIFACFTLLLNTIINTGTAVIITDMNTIVNVMHNYTLFFFDYLKRINSPNLNC